jgi:hypothetical protein
MRKPRRVIAALAIGLVASALALAQMPTPEATSKPEPKAEAAAAKPEEPLAQLAWLAGCWRGSVNRREFREHWMPLRGNLLIGTSQTTLDGQTIEFDYLRIEPRTDGVYYVATPSRQKEESFKLGEIVKDGEDTIFTFENPAHDFPQRILYRRGTMGWLYAHVEGTVSGSERRVIYPMRRIGCESGAVIEQ